jgi:hypothetical protein
MTTFAVMTPAGNFLSDYLPILGVLYWNHCHRMEYYFHISSTAIIFESSEGHKFNIAVSMIVMELHWLFYMKM